ncbi:MAG: Na+/H+ antiporter NhaA [Cytophagales bacterium]|nr:MAG: Na+/H+ antiporter NhaA [Cytophagales bacterium]TAF59703.1 MAG: Na+/H+ antiporter NhaA [Cytophagales bacterium]
MIKRTATLKSKIKLNWNSFKKRDDTTGILLIACTIFSLIMANSAYSQVYLQVWETTIGFFGGSYHAEMHFSHFINDALMTIFFLNVGLEIKDEWLAGSLAIPGSKLRPFLAAGFGMLFPGMIYTAFNLSSSASSGWAIPTATDIAFSVGVLGLLGKRVPESLKIFLLALAVIDDLGAIIVIAAFYTNELHFGYLLLAGACFLFMALVLNWILDIKSPFVYISCGVLLWYFLLKSGIHPTIGGVCTALCIPVGDVNSNSSPLRTLKAALHVPVTFIIIPLFALTNTALVLEGSFSTGLASSCGLGIIFGLFLGKPIGIVLSTWLAAKAGWIRLPENTNLQQLIGVGFLGGIGFTMSIFVSMLAFDAGSDYLVDSRLAVLTGSLFSAITGYLLIRFAPYKELL